MSEKIEPLFDRVLVQRDKPPEKTTHGLIDPSSGKAQLNRGTVIAVGPGKPLDDGSVRAMSVNPGDTVMFGKFDGQEIEINNEGGYLVLTEGEILARITKEG